MNAFKSVANFGSQVNKLLSIRNVVSSRIFNFQSLATTISAPVKLQKSSSASGLIHTDTPKRKELFGANQCDENCQSASNTNCKQCDQYCQTLRDQIEANMKDRAIPKIDETKIKPCIEKAPKKNQSVTSSISGSESEFPKNSQDPVQVPAKQRLPVAMTKPLSTQPTTTKEIDIPTSVPQSSEHPHSYSYLLETCDLNSVDFKSESKFSRPKTIRNLPKKETTTIRRTVSFHSNREVSDKNCLFVGKSGGESCTMFSAPIDKKKETDNCLAFASSNNDAASSLKSAVQSKMPEVRSNSLLHLFEKQKEQKVVSHIKPEPNLAAIALSPCNRPGSTSGGSAPCGGTSGSNQSSSSSSPCKKICNQPTNNSGSTTSNKCQKICGSPSADSQKSECIPNASTNECPSEDKTSICKQVCCQALKDIVEPKPRKKITATIAPSDPTKPVTTSKTACKKRCGTSGSGSEPTADKICSNICNPPEYKAGCGPKPVVLQCDKPAASKPKCNPVKQCTGASKTSTCGSASRAAIKCPKPDSNKTATVEVSKNACGPSKCMPSQPQRPQKRR